MQLKFRILHFFLALLLGVFGIIGLLLLELFGKETPVVDFQIPNQTDWIVRLDAGQLAKDEVYTLLFEAKDNQFLDQLEPIARNRVEKQTENGFLSIDFRQPILVFGSHSDTSQYIGFLVHVTDEVQFLKHINRYLSANQVATVSNHTALILTVPDKDAKTSKKKLQLAAEQLFKNSTAKPPKSTDDVSFLSIDLSNKGNGKKLQLNLFHEPHQLILKGNFHSQKELKPANYSLKNSDLFISSSIIPQGISDSLSQLLGLDSFQFPALRAITMDYKGVVIEQAPGGMLILPKMNAIIETVTPISIQDLFASIPKEWIGDHQTIIIGSITYRVIQLDKNSIFIGIDPTTIVRQKQQTLFAIRGSLTPILTIGGNSFITSFLDVVPAIGAGKRFINGTSSINIAIMPKGKQASVNGVIEFKKDRYALHEMVKLFLVFDVLQ